MKSKPILASGLSVWNCQFRGYCATPREWAVWETESYK
jgi:hypothetical protein